MNQAIADVLPALPVSPSPEFVPAPTSKAPAAPPPHFKTSAFEGPLDLLLHLIRANEVDIYNIPIAEITQQYLDYMDLWEALDLTVAGEYVLIAATLIEIKSRLLLPQQKPENTDEEPEDPRAELVQRLLEYQQYQGTLETLRGGRSSAALSIFGARWKTPTITFCPFPPVKRRHAIVSGTAPPAGGSGRGRAARDVRNAAPSLEPASENGRDRPQNPAGRRPRVSRSTACLNCPAPATTSC